MTNPLGKINFQVTFSDGTVPNRPRGHYWRMEISEGHYGEERGPFPTFDMAELHARKVLDAMVAKIKRQADGRDL